ncbi:unnamed protein product [Leptidea sinapis]|uniref:Uncharacterized protein n=1 Tax=Leptidea sinapis TaxID=189913 RepID=A0A5E4Q900_9NEOP|nr:unnamed protein product [Leptidea sinapis]
MTLTGKEMPNQGGLKHVVTEPGGLETKRERRRPGVPGRASALRRAPSDSDCSGETASLSADSGDRSVRVPAPPPRTNKSRGSRRRGSEWEVLEGLKDGQRFDKRPEVFNGYLHKKRKWPLKGWHKARRRRIDIDADEFIYHLRAKTPDMFRTWLNVLKAHRLYRQHLLTFGARESVPKIHPPAEDLPPIDTSSRTTNSSSQAISERTPSNEEFAAPKFVDPASKTITASPIFTNNKSRNILKSQLIGKLHDDVGAKPGKIDNLNMKKSNCQTEVDQITRKSLCSLHCMGHNSIDCLTLKQSRKDLDSVDPKMLHSDVNTLSRYQQKSSLILEYSLSSAPDNTSPFKAGNNVRGSDSERVATFFFLSRKRDTVTPPLESKMRRSKKSTNLVKYRNIYVEPKLRNHSSNFILLSKYKYKDNIYLEDEHDKEMPIAKSHKESQANYVSNNKSMQDTMTLYEYDLVTEKLMTSVFDTYKNLKKVNDDVLLKNYINQIVKELYDLKFSTTEYHPLKVLFRCLLEYWLKTTSYVDCKEAIMKTKSIDRQSIQYFTEDRNLSSLYVPMVSKQTQIQRTRSKKKPAKSPISKQRSDEKERRIQEVETMLKNTVYICNTIRSNQSKNNDIKITKKLIDNMEKLSYENNLDTDNPKGDDSNSSNELAKIQDTIERLISDTSMPAAIAKDFLHAYLEFLHSSRSVTETSTSQDESTRETTYPMCDVLTESVQKKVSRCITTKESNDDNTTAECQSRNPGQLQLKHVLDNITTIFSKDCLPENEKETNGKINTKKHRGFLTCAKVKKDTSKDIANYLNDNRLQANEVTVNVATENIVFHKNSDSSHSDISGSNKYFRSTSEKSNVISKICPLIGNDVLCYKDLDIRPYTSNEDASTKFHSIRETYISDSDATSKAYGVGNYSIESYERREEITVPDTLDAVAFDNKTRSCYLLSLKRLERHIHRKKNSSSGNKINVSSSTTYLEGKSIFEMESRHIDEKLILVFLENLCYMSKKIPAMHKDINNFYLKLKKKYDKAMMHASKTQGLSLLGKIYTEFNDVKSFEDKSTQYEKYCGYREYKDTVTSTADFTIQYLKCDSATSACCLLKDFNNVNIQTEASKLMFKDEEDTTRNEPAFRATDCTQTNSFSSLSSINQIQGTSRDVATNRRVSAKNCGVNTFIKFILDDNSNFRITKYSPEGQMTRKNKNIVMALKLKPHIRNSTKYRNNLIEEITRLSSALKVSTYSQTERSLQCTRDYQICQLFVSNKYKPKKSASVTDSNAEMRERSDEMKTLYRCSSYPSYCSELVSPSSGQLRGPQAGFVSGTPGGRLASWIIEGASPNVKKDRRKFGLRKKKSSNKCTSVDLQPPHIDLSNSHMALSTLTAPPSPGGCASSVPNSAASLPIACAATRPQSLPGAEALNAAPASLCSLTPDHHLREDFTVLAKDLCGLGYVSGAMPPEYELYYGFTRFAMELNEIEPGTRELLPYTDTRLRLCIKQYEVLC